MAGFAISPLVRGLAPEDVLIFGETTFMRRPSQWHSSNRAQTRENRRSESNFAYSRTAPKTVNSGPNPANRDRLTIGSSGPGDTYWLSKTRTAQEGAAVDARIRTKESESPRSLHRLHS